MERKRSVRRNRRNERTFTKRCKDYIRSFIAFLFSNLGIIGLVIGYTMSGALIFRAIEKDYSLQVKIEVENSKNTTVDQIWNFTLFMNPFLEEEYRDMLEEQLMNFQTSIVRYVRKGYDGSTLLYSQQWSIAGSFLYSLTLITTIGYGNITPHTMAGQIMTIFYAIIGMPLFLLYLSNIGDLLAKSFKWIYANICLCRWCPGVASRRAERKRKADKIRYYSEDGESSEGSSEVKENEDTQKKIYRTISAVTEIDEQDSEDSYDVESVTVPITVCLMIMVGYICFGGFLFCKWEDWKFLEAAYFCFISLSTIGFGDFVPGDKIIGHSDPTEVLVDEVLELRFVFCAVYLMLGMALIAMCFNLMQDSEHFDEIYTEDVNCMRRNMYIARRGIQPKLPQTQSEVLEVLVNLHPKTLQGEDFLTIVDREDNIIVLLCCKNLKFSCSVDTIYMDGTFEYYTKFYQQMFTVHPFKNGHYVPVLFVLLPNKSTDNYVQLLSKVIQKCLDLGLIFSLKIIVVYFERAIHNAISTV